jgi:hypothetical protein
MLKREWEKWKPTNNERPTTPRLCSSAPSCSRLPAPRAHVSPPPPRFLLPYGSGHARWRVTPSSCRKPPAYPQPPIPSFICCSRSLSHGATHRQPPSREGPWSLSRSRGEESPRRSRWALLLLLSVLAGAVGHRKILPLSSLVILCYKVLDEITV